MKSIFKLVVIWSCTPLLIASCRKADNPSAAGNTGKVKLEFFNVVGGSNLNLNTQWYKNANGDSFTVSTFNYYVSNIVLNGASGQTYIEPESYHLIQQGDLTSTSFDMVNIPVGTYNSVTFTIGVDSAHNVSGAQSGALDPSYGMFWTWKSGYIMLKMEGNSPKSTASDGALTFHCGGFTGANSVLKTVTVNFPNSIDISGATLPHVHLQADLLKMFQSPNRIDFAVESYAMNAGAAARLLADNYANMFTSTYAGL